MNLKKPKFWDLKKPNLLSLALLPFTIFLIISNFFLNLKLKNSDKKIKSICVGNIYVGGTGKTPTTVKIYEILKRLNFNVVTGKKFYDTQLDENIILEKKTNLISASSRTEILNLAKKSQNRVIIFDDGLQDKRVSYDLELVCFNSDNLIGNSLLIPAGPLREKIKSLKKYDAIFLKNETKIPSNQIDFIKKFNKDIKIFRTFFEICNLEKFNLKDSYLIFSGIGNPQSFKNILTQNQFNIVDEIIYSDHKKYSKKEINYITERAKKLNAKILTTEKDFVKISKLDPKFAEFIELRLVIENEKEFEKFLLNKLNG
tara:strand:+ start:35 stop:979 length:945 start_codon:yes stop_codon:yes gene_type:complete